MSIAGKDSGRNVCEEPFVFLTKLTIWRMLDTKGNGLGLPVRRYSTRSD